MHEKLKLRRELKTYWEKVAGSVRDTALTVAWLNTKDTEGDRENFRMACFDIYYNLTSPDIKARLIVSNLTAILLGGLIAYKAAFWSNYFDDTRQVVMHKADVKAPPDLMDLRNHARELIVKPHQEAHYIKSILSTTALADILVLLSMCTATRRRRESGGLEDSPANDAAPS